MRFGRKRLERRRRRHACAPCERLTAGCTSSPGRSVGREKRMAVAARLEISRADREPRLRANGGPCGSRAANRARQAHGAVQMPRLWASPEVSPLIPGRERADVAAVGPRQATELRFQPYKYVPGGRAHGPGPCGPGPNSATALMKSNREIPGEMSSCSNVARCFFVQRTWALRLVSPRHPQRPTADPQRQIWIPKSMGLFAGTSARPLPCMARPGDTGRARRGCPSPCRPHLSPYGDRETWVALRLQCFGGVAVCTAALCARSLLEIVRVAPACGMRPPLKEDRPPTETGTAFCRSWFCISFCSGTSGKLIRVRSPRWDTTA